MKAIFLIYRTNYYRFFYSLIQEALERRYQVECWHDYSHPRTGQKGYNFPDISKIPSFQTINQPKVKTFYGDEELEKLLIADKEIDAVFSIHMSGFRLRKETIARFPFYWVVVATGADSFFELENILRKSPRPNPKEIFFVHSNDWLDKGKKYLKKFYPEHANFLEKNVKCKISGNPEFDVFKNIDTNEVRKKYGIPENKPILLYLPFPYDNRSKNSAWERAFCGILVNTFQAKDGAYFHNRRKSFITNFIDKVYCIYQIAKDPSARHYWLKGINEEKVFNAIRRFCDKNGLYLVSKPRVKFPIAEIVKRKSDLLIWDTEKQQNPPILKELVSLAKLTVSFLSTSVLTAVAGGAYHLNINLPKDFFMHEKHKFLFSAEHPSQFNFNGVCKSWPIEDVVSNLENASLDEFSMDSQKRREYMDKYIGFGDCASSGRILDALSEFKLYEG